jgi:hypothetical protein
MAFDGVSAAAVLPRNRGAGTVDIVVTSHSGLPDDELLEKLQNYFTQVREIAVDVAVRPPEVINVNMNIGITPKPGYTFEQVAQNAEAERFLRERANYHPEDIAPALTTTFERITLVNKAHTERLTIDLNLRFCNVRKQTTGEMEGLVIVELKQDGMYFSPMKEILQRLRVKPFKVSKYCLGTVLTDADVKQNRYKQKIRLIEKMLNS